MKNQKKLSNPEIEQVMEQMPARNGNKENYPVLIIDDDTWIQRIVSHYLQSWGFKTYSALDAYDGVSLAIKHRPVMIILDIIMPEIEGDILLKIIKRIEMTSEIPVLVISSNLNMEVLGHTFREGASGFISKPFSQQILFDKIQKCLGPDVFNQIQSDKSQLSSKPDIVDSGNKEMYFEFNKGLVNSQ